MWSHKNLAKALDIDLGQNIIANEIKIDTRLLAKGDVFLAIDNGHNHIKTAYEKGALCAIGENGADIIVKNSYEALKSLAIFARDHSKARRIAITGSMGKTTTKEMFKNVLNESAIASYASYNNHLGVPLTLARLKADTEVGVFEVGTNHRGEIGNLSHMIQPHIGIVTAVGLSHIGYFDGKIENIIEEKLSLFDHVTDCIILPKWLEHFLKSPKADVITFGEHGNIKLVGFEGNKACISIFGKKHNFNLPSITNINNFLALLCGLYCLNYDLQSLDTNMLLPPEGRGKIETIKQNIKLIDDAYNGSFDSMLSGIRNLSQHRGKKMAILGDMSELGGAAHIYHQRVIETAQSLAIDYIVPCGAHFAHALGIPSFTHEQALELVHETKPDVVWIKGSKGSKVSEVVKMLRGQLSS